MREGYNHQYPPEGWTVDTIETALTEYTQGFPIPSFDTRDAWKEIQTDGMTAPIVERIINTASDMLNEPIPELRASLYLDYTRTGNRVRYQDPNAERRYRLSLFTLAECFEREGRFLDAVLDYAWAICEQASWVMPAHLRGERNVEGLPQPVPETEQMVALASASTAQLLAEVDYILGDRLHPALREQIRSEVNQRVLIPYERNDDHWWMTPPTNNWNAVCNAGVLIASLHLVEDRSQQAVLVKRVSDSLRHYLNDFDNEGCTAEGISYWNYGFGHYVQAAAHLETRTDGTCSLLSPPIVNEIVQYPQRVKLSPGHYLPFSDANEETVPAPYAACWTGEYLNRPALAAQGRKAFTATRPVDELSETIRNLVWCRRVPPEWEIPVPDEYQYFTGHDWWLVRETPDNPDGVVVAAKGGHNAESHNHNDCGSFIYHVRGESLLTDLGSPTYDRDFFSEKRYEYLSARSLGHSVPYVNGYEQAAGVDHAAVVVDQERTDNDETFVLDLADTYPDDAGLDSLQRCFSLDPGGSGELTITDRITFTDDTPGQEFESILISYFPMKSTDNELLVRGQRTHARVKVAPSTAIIDVERLPQAIDDRDVWRGQITAPMTSDDPDTEIAITLTMTYHRNTDE